ncbi:hypothetical protein FB451DRAFT_1177168 [Mycena latifolia]|nr:hypothetical protein FB451DRAFT_1177168 [Mycena latifolia]
MSVTVGFLLPPYGNRQAKGPQDIQTIYNKISALHSQYWQQITSVGRYTRSFRGIRMNPSLDVEYGLKSHRRPCVIPIVNFKTLFMTDILQNFDSPSSTTRTTAILRPSPQHPVAQPSPVSPPPSLSTVPSSLLAGLQDIGNAGSLGAGLVPAVQGCSRGAGADLLLCLIMAWKQAQGFNMNHCGFLTVHRKKNVVNVPCPEAASVAILSAFHVAEFGTFWFALCRQIRNT